MQLTLFVAIQAFLPFLSGALFIVPLSKQHVPVKVKGKTVSHKTAYSGTIYVGLPVPQEFTVVFDTGSGHLFLPSSTCEDAPCLKHRRYDGILSNSGIEINDDGSAVLPDGDVERDSVSIAYGTGEIVGEFISELVCIGSPMADGTAQDALLALNSSRQGGSSLSSLPDHCTEARVVLASEMTNDPFNTFDFDGVMGLGLDTLSLNAEFHLLGQLTKLRNMSPIFAVFLAIAPDGVSEVSFGGHDERRTGGAELQWAPIDSPEMGYWRVKVYGLLLDGKPAGLCEDGHCYAILDTGTSMLGVPKDGLQGLLSSTARRLPSDSSQQDCRNVPGPELTFSLGNFNITLGAKDYSRPAPSQIQNVSGGAPSIICRASMLPVEMPQLGEKVFLFGEPVLKRYYTAYDAGNRRVGFAQAVQPSAEVPVVV